MVENCEKCDLWQISPDEEVGIDEGGQKNDRDKASSEKRIEVGTSDKIEDSL